MVSGPFLGRASLNFCQDQPGRNQIGTKAKAKAKAKSYFYFFVTEEILYSITAVFQVAGGGDRTADPWVTSPMLPPLHLGGLSGVNIMLRI